MGTGEFDAGSNVPVKSKLQHPPPPGIRRRFFLPRRGGGHLITFLAQGGGNLERNFPKIQMPGGLPEGRGGGVMLKLRFDWYITLRWTSISSRRE